MFDQRISLPQQANSGPCIILIAVILAIGVLYVASDLFVPLTISILAFLALRPVTVRLCRWRVPQTIASGGVIAAFFCLVAVIATMLYSPVQSWTARAPDSLGKFKSNFHSLTESIEEIDEAETAAEQTQRQLDMGQERVEVELSKPDLVDPAYLINTTGNVLAFIVAVAVLTFFMLSTGDDLINRILNVMSDSGKRAEMLKTVGDIQDNVGRYLGQITLINCGLGVAVTLVMWLVGMPTPLLWGTMAGLFNFIPYVGPVAATGVVLLAAGSVFDSTSRALLTAGVFWGTTAIEGQFVTSVVLGRTLRVGPVIVLVAVAFWGFIWGLPGVLLAVPLLIVMRQVFAAFESTFPLAVILGEEACDETSEDCDLVKDDEEIKQAASTSVSA